MLLLFLEISYKWNHIIYSCLLLFLLNIIFVSPSYWCIYQYFLLYAKQYSIVCHILSHSSSAWHCMNLWVISILGPIWILFLWTLCIRFCGYINSFVLGKYLGVKLLECIVSIMFNSKYSKCFTKWSYCCKFYQIYMKITLVPDPYQYAILSIYFVLSILAMCTVISL